jgi:hypothetical protein
VLRKKNLDKNESELENIMRKLSNTYPRFEKKYTVTCLFIVALNNREEVNNMDISRVRTEKLLAPQH